MRTAATTDRRRPIVVRPGHVDPDDVLAEPIIVMGAPRSGTTFLANLLSSHPDVGLVHEPRLVWRYGNDNRSDMLTPDDARPKVRAYIRRQLRTAVISQQGRRLVEKTPSNSLRLGFVDEVLPGAHYIHIIRDGRDAVASIVRRWRDEGKRRDAGLERDRLLVRAREASWRQRLSYAGEAVRRLLPTTRHTPPLWGPRLPGIADLVNELGIAGVAALQWRTCVEHARWYGQEHLGNRYVEVRLEELDAQRLAGLLDFVGLDDTDRKLSSAFREQFTPPAHDGRAALDEVESRTIRTWITPTQMMLGYE